MKSNDDSSSSSSNQKHIHGCAFSHRGLSNKYQPKVFEDIVGHDFIIQALSNAIQWNKISPLYLFHGPGGTGKTSAAKIFATAINGESYATSELCFKTIHSFIQNSALAEASSHVKVFIIHNELGSESSQWGELLNLVREIEGERCGSVVFILITEDENTVPRAVSSCCLKFNFSKLRDIDVLIKLSRIVAQEGIKIMEDALILIARKADGNLREAENLLDQIALLDSEIDTSMIQKLLGLVPRNKLVSLLEAALSENSAEAVKYARDLISSGIEPKRLVSQMSSFAVELLSDSSSSTSTESHSQLRNKQPERLGQILNILIETEKQLAMLKCDHTVSVLAAILQVSSAIPSADIRANRSNRLDSEDAESIPITHHLNNSIVNPNAGVKSIDIDELWHNILLKIQNRSIRNFLQRQAKLLSLTVARENAVVHLMMKHLEEFPNKSIENTLRAALGCSVTLNIRGSQNLFLSDLPIHEGSNNMHTDSKMDTSGRNQSFDTTSIAKTTELKLRMLSVLPIPQTDASIEPYSQDLLFEEANTDRRLGGGSSVLYKDFLRPKQHRHSIYYINKRLNCSQSCKENFRRGENMVNEDMMGLPSRNHFLKWAHPCRNSTTINSISKKRTI